MPHRTAHSPTRSLIIVFFFRYDGGAPGIASNDFFADAMAGDFSARVPCRSAHLPETSGLRNAPSSTIERDSAFLSSSPAKEITYISSIRD